jgi:hypothetical protein
MTLSRPDPQQKKRGHSGEFRGNSGDTILNSGAVVEGNSGDTRKTPVKAGRELRMKEPPQRGIANHLDPGYQGGQAPITQHKWGARGQVSN